MNIIRIRYEIRCTLCTVMYKFLNVLLLLRLFTLPQSRIYTPGTCNPNAYGSDACSGSNNLWTRTLDRYTRADLTECVVSTMSVPPPKSTQDRTQAKNTHTIPGQKLKCLTSPRIQPRPPGCKTGTLQTTPRRAALILHVHAVKIK